MNDAFLVGGVEGVGNLNSDVEKHIHRERPPGDTILERFAFEQFHHEEEFSFVFFDLVNRANIGMIQGRGGTGFAAEAL